jgi:ankyrin repeat protein
LEIVKFLAETGANKEAKANTNWTPLHFAVRWGHLEIVKFLVESGADKEAKNMKGHTPLQLAQQHGNTSIVDFLKLVKSSNKTGLIHCFFNLFL